MELVNLRKPVKTGIFNSLKTVLSKSDEQMFCAAFSRFVTNSDQLAMLSLISRICPTRAGVGCVLALSNNNDNIFFTVIFVLTYS